MFSSFTLLEIIVFIIVFLVSSYVLKVLVNFSYLKPKERFSNCEPTQQRYTNVLWLRISDVNSFFFVLIALLIHLGHESVFIDFGELELVGISIRVYSWVLFILALVSLGLKNIKMERKERNRYLILSLLSEGEELSVDEIVSCANSRGRGKELSEKGFYETIGDLLRTGLVVNCTKPEALSISEQVFYQITDKGSRVYQQYLAWELEKIGKERFLCRQSGSVSQFLELDKREELVKKEMDKL